MTSPADFPRGKISNSGIGVALGLGLAVGAGGGWLLHGAAPASPSDHAADVPVHAPTPVGAESAGTPAAPANQEATVIPAVHDPARPSAPPDGEPAPASCNAWVEQLASAREEIAVHRRAAEACEGDHRDEHGEPIATPAELAPRFAQAAIETAMTTAIAGARAPGSSLQGMDCSEYPCIAFGRLAGTEETLERIERSRALAAYRHDVQTALLWMSFGGESEGQSEEDERAEVGLFAMAFYTQEEATRMGDALDRRVRSRTAALWNAIRPGDEIPAGDAP